MLSGQSDQISSSQNQNVVVTELQSVVDQRFTSLNLGERISRDVSKRVGSGSYGLVYEGTLYPQQLKVAVKVVRYGDKNDLPVLKRLLAEVYIWSKLAHENILELLGITTAFDHTISIVSPLMPRGNAFDFVQDVDNDPRPLILGIANGLHYLHVHELGPIIHGDIKGSNVLISDDGHALLTDFGTSHLAATSFSITREQHPGGTLDWMAPEYLDTDQLTMTTAGDIWAFGMTALELFTRKRPFDHLKNRAMIMYHILLKERERPSDEIVYSRLTDGWWNLCLSCWHRDPLLRPSMSDLVKNTRALQTISKIDASPLPCETVLRRHANQESTDDDTSPTSEDLRRTLKELARRAMRYSILLDGRVSNNNTTLRRGGYATVRRGTLSPEPKVAIAATGEEKDTMVQRPSNMEESKVAIKTPLSSSLGDLETIKRFLREAHIWSKLRHHHILPFLGITTDFDLTVSIVSPWMDKGNAHDYVQDTTIDPRPLIRGIAQGLCYLHNYPSGPIIHGNLKGANILISDDGGALLHDFGHSLLLNSSFSLTISGPHGGTPNWMAPEVFAKFDVSTEADVWAFGMTCLELFVRRIPFHDARNVVGVTQRIFQGPPDRPSKEETRSRMTNRWWDMCFSCWNRDPSLRPTMLHIVQTIEKVKMRSGVTTHGKTKGNLMLTLEEFAEKASSYMVQIGQGGVTPSRDQPSSIILNGRVSRDNNIFLRGGYATVCSGTLYPKEKAAASATVGSRLLDEEQAMKIKVAIKTPHGGPPGDIETIQHFLRKLHLWWTVRHEHIIPLLGITTDFERTVSIVTPWMAKGNAHNYVQDQAIDPRPLILGIARGLHYLHNHSSGSIIHGDMKGVNVVISEDGRALLLDFGFSSLINSSFTLTISAPLKDILNWVAPEILDNGYGSAEADVWAFGMTALELFTRRIPFHDRQTIKSLFTRIRQGPPDRPSDEETCSRLTNQWWDMCSSCWNRDPSLRPTMSDIVRTIKRMIDSDLTMHNETTMDPTFALQELASSYDMHLNEQVDRDERTPIHGNTAIIYRGKLHQGGIWTRVAALCCLRRCMATNVAVKTIRSRPPRNMDVVKHIIGEVHVWTTLRHENILPLFGITTKFDGTVSLVSEWMKMGNAHEYVQNCDVDPSPLLLGVANGLCFLHTLAPRPIFHGSLKGSNVLISYRGEALLSDFGLSSLLESSFPITVEVSSVGTINWRSPEHLDVPRGSAAGDVWAFGMTALELFTRAFPFHSIWNSKELEQRITLGPPDRPSDEITCQRLTDGWWKICSWCWQCDPSLRPSIEEVLRMIEDELLESLRRDGDSFRRLLMEKMRERA